MRLLSEGWTWIFITIFLRCVSFTSSQTPSAVDSCRELGLADVPANGGLIRYMDPSTDTLYCTLLCNHGYNVAAHPSDYESCGSDTDYIWSYQQEEGDAQLLRCILSVSGDRFHQDKFYFPSTCDETDPGWLSTRTLEVGGETLYPDSLICGVVPCRELGLADVPDNGGLILYTDPSSDMLYFTLLCNHGYNVAAHPSDYETCGQATGYIWSYQQEEEDAQLLRCIQSSERYHQDRFYFDSTCESVLTDPGWPSSYPLDISDHLLYPDNIICGLTGAPPITPTGAPPTIPTTLGPEHCIHTIRQVVPAHGGYTCHHHHTTHSWYCQRLCNHGYEHPQPPDANNWCGEENGYTWTSGVTKCEATASGHEYGHPFYFVSTCEAARSSESWQTDYPMRIEDGYVTPDKIFCGDLMSITVSPDPAYSPGEVILQCSFDLTQSTFSSLSWSRGLTSRHIFRLSADQAPSQNDGGEITSSSLSLTKDGANELSTQWITLVVSPCRADQQDVYFCIVTDTSGLERTAAFELLLSRKDPEVYVGLEDMEDKVTISSDVISLSTVVGSYSLGKQLPDVSFFTVVPPPTASSTANTTWLVSQGDLIQQEEGVTCSWKGVQKGKVNFSSPGSHVLRYTVSIDGNKYTAQMIVTAENEGEELVVLIAAVIAGVTLLAVVTLVFIIIIVRRRRRREAGTRNKPPDAHRVGKVDVATISAPVRFSERQSGEYDEIPDYDDSRRSTNSNSNENQTNWGYPSDVNTTPRRLCSPDRASSGIYMKPSCVQSTPGGEMSSSAISRNNSSVNSGSQPTLLPSMFSVYPFVGTDRNDFLQEPHPMRAVQMSPAHFADQMDFTQEREVEEDPPYVNAKTLEAAYHNNGPVSGNRRH